MCIRDSAYAEEAEEEQEMIQEDFDWRGTLQTDGAPRRDTLVDPAEFKCTRRKPYKWKEAVDYASDVHIASIRLLLEVVTLTTIFMSPKVHLAHVSLFFVRQYLEECADLSWQAFTYRISCSFYLRLQRRLSARLGSLL